MTTFVINLERSPDRRQFMEAQLTVFRSLRVEFYAAVDGRALGDEDLVGVYDDARCQLTLERGLSRPEIGCALSHIGVYREIVHRGLDSALVLEDDALVSGAVGPFLEDVTQHLDPRVPSVVLLSPASFRTAPPVVRSSVASLYRYADGHYATGYWINNAGARLLSQELFPVWTVADKWQFFTKVLRLKVYSTVPYLVGLSRSEFIPSAIIEGRAQAGGMAVVSTSPGIDSFVPKVWRRLGKLLSGIRDQKVVF